MQMQVSMLAGPMSLQTLLFSQSCSPHSQSTSPSHSSGIGAHEYVFMNDWNSTQTWSSVHASQSSTVMPVLELPSDSVDPVPVSVSVSVLVPVSVSVPVDVGSAVLELSVSLVLLEVDMVLDVDIVELVDMVPLIEAAVALPVEESPVSPPPPPSSPQPASTRTASKPMEPKVVVFMERRRSSASPRERRVRVSSSGCVRRSRRACTSSHRAAGMA